MAVARAALVGLSMSSNLWQRRSLGASSFLEYPVGMELAPLHSRGKDSDEDAYALTG